MEPEFPIEFLVLGTPVSHQVKRREALDEWKSLVAEACRRALPEEMAFLTSRRLSLALLYFQEEPGGLDLDNMAKPVLDALTNVLYHDDRQVDRLTIQRFSSESDVDHLNRSDKLHEAMSGEKPVLYVRISDNLRENIP